MLNTAEEACALAQRTGSKNIGVLLDAFHMNMEEKDIGAAIRRSARAFGFTSIVSRMIAVYPGPGTPPGRRFSRHSAISAMIVG